jgi:RNA ligase
MNIYEFPKIKTIEDVLDDLNGYDEIRVIEKDWYTVINYAVALEDTFEWDCEDPHSSSIRRECRGLIFDKQGKLISRPYHKFFNACEKEETQLNKINLYEPHVVLEKLDGSMIRPIPTKEGFRLATKAGITDVAMNAEVFIASDMDYVDIIRGLIEGGMTPIFEWCSRKNRIVVDYPEDQLILTAIRDTETGEYVPYAEMVEIAEHSGIPVVKAVDGLAVQDINLFVKQVREWDDGEGVVLRFDTGHMVKVKADDYVLRHKTKDSISQEKNVIQVILDDSVDDLVPLLTPQDAERLKDFQHSFWSNVDAAAISLAIQFVPANKKYPDKKDFAVEFVQKLEDSRLMPIMYSMRAGKNAHEAIADMIGKSLSTQTKIDQNRWLWGNLKWNA